MLGELCEGVSRRGAFRATEERHSVDVFWKIGCVNAGIKKKNESPVQ
jgi:hypothetical protein